VNDARSNYTALIVDDETSRAEDWSRSLEEITNIQPSHASRDAVERDFGRLVDLRRKLREGDELPDADLEALNQHDILVIDFDLIDISPSLTAPSLAYLVNMFTDVPVIAILNEIWESDFDLTFAPHDEPMADAYLGSDHLLRPGLWNTHFEDFRPWNWPVLTLEVDKWPIRLERALKAIHQGQSVMDFLGLRGAPMTDDALDWLLKGHQSDSGEPASELEEMTIEQWVTGSPNLLERRERKALKEHGRQDRLIARVAARGLTRWIDQFVLAAQYPLIDLPHLYAKMPSGFLGHDRQEVRSRIVDPGIHPLEPILAPELHSYIYSSGVVPSRPLLRWDLIEENAGELHSLFSEVDDGESEIVFLEDSSSFAAVEDAIPIRIGVDVLDNRRYVDGNLDGVNYSPKSKLLEE
jgi:hypothetical protein